MQTETIPRITTINQHFHNPKATLHQFGHRNNIKCNLFQPLKPFCYSAVLVAFSQMRNRP